MNDETKELIAALKGGNSMGDFLEKMMAIRMMDRDKEEDSISMKDMMNLFMMKTLLAEPASKTSPLDKVAEMMMTQKVIESLSNGDGDTLELLKEIIANKDDDKTADLIERLTAETIKNKDSEIARVLETFAERQRALEERMDQQAQAFTDALSNIVNALSNLSMSQGGNPEQVDTLPLKTVKTLTEQLQGDGFLSPHPPQDKEFELTRMELQQQQEANKVALDGLKTVVEEGVNEIRETNQTIRDIVKMIIQSRLNGGSVPQAADSAVGSVPEEKKEELLNEAYAQVQQMILSGQVTEDEGYKVLAEIERKVADS